MKPIEFKLSASQKIYADYIKRIKKMSATLPNEDRQELLMEFNSHIYEATAESTKEAEVDKLMDVIEKLGSPEEVLKPMIAERKLYQASKTFNPLHVFKAIALNIGNGIAYFFFAIMYLLLGGFIFTIFAKITNPEEVGLFFNDGKFQALGAMDIDSINNSGSYEVLGNWYIPVMIIVSLLWYLFTTFLLRFMRTKN